jgi:hypothetical protein
MEHLSKKKGSLTVLKTIKTVVMEQTVLVFSRPPKASK